MTISERFPFLIRDPRVGAASLAPVVTLELSATTRVALPALLDTGASINLIPYDIGERLGFVWDDLTTQIKLGGNLADCEARVILAHARIGNLPSAKLAFAWAESDAVPAILGQVNFFQKFDVCFFRSDGYFEIRARP